MKGRPQRAHGITVPYGAPTHELIAQTQGETAMRWVAFIALAHDPSSDARDALRRATRSPDPHVRRAAIEALSCRTVEPDDAALIVSAFADAAGHVVRTACEAAASARIRDAHAHVLALVSCADAATRRTALRALRHLWQADDFGAVFRVFQEDQSPEVRNEAAWTLRAWVRLFAAWHRDGLHRHRLWACEIAREFGAHEVADSLAALTTDRDGLVRRAAKQALSMCSDSR
jgi:HEAT repeat protein